jgi:hypothetical protein
VSETPALIKQVRDISWRAIFCGAPRSTLAFFANQARHGQAQKQQLALDALKQILQINPTSLQKMLRAAKDMSEISLLSVWLSLHYYSWGAHYFAHDKKQLFIDFVALNVKDQKIHSYFAKQLLFIFLKAADLESVLALFKACPTLSPQTLYIKDRIKLLQCLQIRSDMPAAELATLRHNTLQRLTPIDRWKCRILAAGAVAPALTPTGGQDLEQSFAVRLPVHLRREFRSFVTDCYEPLRPRMQLMNIRYDANQSVHLFQLIDQALINCTPFALMRLSDGEGYIFSDSGIFYTDDCVLAQELHWWGINLSDAERTSLRRKLQSAIQEADVVGIPCIYRFIRDIGFHQASMLDNRTVRGLLEVLHHVPKATSRRVLFTDEKCNAFLFDSVEAIQQIGKHAKSVIFVGSLRANILHTLFPPNFIRKIISLTTHFRNQGDPDFVCDGPPLARSYNEALVSIRNNVQPGDLVLVSAGVVGKLLIAEAKRAGAVALDVGNSLESMLLQYRMSKRGAASIPTARYSKSLARIGW